MNDYESIQRRRNIEVGVFVLLALCAVVWLIFKFGDLPVRVSEFKSFKVFVRFPTASGVQENTPVRFCGYQIGRVVDVRGPEILKDLNTDKFYYQTEVVLNIDSKYDNIPANVEVKLMTRGLGSSFVEFKAGPFDVKEPLGDCLENGSLIQGSAGMTSEFFPEESQKKLDELVDNLASLINNANEILGDKSNKENFRATMANLSQATAQATEAVKEFRKLASTGTDALQNAESRMEKLVVAAIDTSEQLAKAMYQMRLILEKINAGEGAAGKFITDARLYEGLLESSQQLQLLLEDIRAFIAESRDGGVPIKLK